MLRLDRSETITDSERREVLILLEVPALTVTWSRYAPGERGPDLHVHREHTDAFYVLDGVLTFELGPDGHRTVLGPGGYVAVPPDLAHSFWNGGDRDARWLNLHAPDTRFGDFLRSLRDGTDGSFFDTYDAPAEGGRPADAAILAGPGEGERAASGALIKAAQPELTVAELPAEAPLPDGAACWALDGAVLAAFAPDAGAAARLRGA